MATTSFLSAPLIRRFAFSQYSQGSVASFATAFNADWAPYLAGGAAVVIAAKAGAATVAEIVISPNQVLEVSPTDWVGYSATNGWQVIPVASMGRTVADGATNSNTTVTSATAAFVSNDVGAIISTPNLPSGTTIVSLNSGTSVVVSATATATGTSQAMTITRTTALYTPAVI